MALPFADARPTPVTPPASSDRERPPQSGWYWNSNRLARAWLPLIGLEGLGLLDFYLAMADHRPGAAEPGWAAVTLAELCRLTGWGRARLVRLNRLLAAAGLLETRQAPVPGRGPAVRRSLYRPCRTARQPDATTLARLEALAVADSTLAARLRRHAAPPPAPSHAPREDEPTSRPAEPTAGAPPALLPTSARLAPLSQREPEALVAPPALEPEPEPSGAPVPVPPRNRSVDSLKTNQRETTTNAREDERVALERWQAANGRPASCLERQRLAQIAAQAEPVARSTGASGWDWVAAAIAEAVEAGSAYVAPRRVARIIDRWAATGKIDITHGSEESARSAHRREPARRRRQERHTGAPPAPHGSDEPEEATVTVQTIAALEEELPRWQAPEALPGLPAAPVAVLRAALAAVGLEHEPYLRGAALAGWTVAGELVVATPAPLPPVVASRLGRQLEQGLGRIIGRRTPCDLAPMAALAAVEAAR